MISFKATSALDMRGPTSTRGRCPMVNCRTRLDTRLTRSAVFGMIFDASSRSWLDIGRLSSARQNTEGEGGGRWGENVCLSSGFRVGEAEKGGNRLRDRGRERARLEDEP